MKVCLSRQTKQKGQKTCWAIEPYLPFRSGVAFRSKRREIIFRVHFFLNFLTLARLCKQNQGPEEYSTKIELGHLRQLARLKKSKKKEDKKFDSETENNSLGFPSQNFFLAR
eukprot:Pompholyxophrys_punicea_v1_NODE_79_length_3711_cov_11.301422.p4 type:complete len:112 gc:universal NODE_79_length_3711_cov_11.301422:1113-778(-)